MITRCPSSVRPSVRPSVFRPSSLNFHIFNLFETTDRNSIKLDMKQDLNVLYQVYVFRADRKKKMATLASDLLRHFRLLWNCWSEFNETWREARSLCPLPSLCFLGRSEKQDGRPGLWLAETFSSPPLKPLIGIQRNLTGSKISMYYTKFVFFFGPIGKTRRLPWPLIGWDIFDFSSETAERNWTKLDRKQDLNVLHQVCDFRANPKKKDGRPNSDWLRHFGLLWNRWTEFNETWQEARSQCPLPSLCFTGRSEKEDGHPGVWLTRGKISTSSNEFVIFMPTSLQKWPPWVICQKGGTLYPGARYVPFEPLVWVDRKIKMTALASDWLWHFRLLRWNRRTAKLDRKQDLNILYQVCVFSDQSEKQDGCPSSDLLRYFRLLLWNHWTEFNHDVNVLYQVCVFGPIRKKKQDARPVSDWLRHLRLLLWNRWIEFNGPWQDASSQHPLPSLFCRPIGKSRCPTGPLLAETFSTIPLKPLNGMTSVLLMYSSVLLSSEKMESQHSN